MTGHSFGGHALDRLTFDYMPDDGGVAGGDVGGTAGRSPDAAQVAAPDPGAAGEPVSSAGATAPAVPPTPSLDPREVQAELDYLRAQNQQIADAFQHLAATGQQQPQQGAPFDIGQLNPLDENFGQALAGLLATQQQQTLAAMQQMVGQVAAPLAAQQQAQVAAEGEQRLNDMVADDVARNGEFAADPQADAQARALVRTVAEQMFPDIANRYGATPRAAEIAMGQAAQQVRGLLAAVGQQAQASQANRLATLAGQHGEPGVGAGSGAQVPSAASVKPESLAAKYAARARAANAA